MRYAIVAVLLATVTVGAQAPAFEVASVKPRKDTNGPALLGIPDAGVVTTTNYPLLWLITYAYSLKNLYQVSGNPEWLSNERFDIRALPPGGVARDQIPLMMQALLAERFKLRVHWETREQPIYALVLAREDGKLGPELKPSKHDCAAFLATGANAYDASAPRDSRGRILCSRGGRIGAAVGTTIGGAPLSDLVTWLESFGAAWGGIDRPVVDRTNLTGNFDASIEFAFRPNRPAVKTTDRPDVADIHQALQEQLGLKLESRRAPAQILVIDSVERPTPD